MSTWPTDSADVLRNIRAELDRDRRRHLTVLAPVLVAAVVIAIAVTVLVTRSTAGRPARPAGGTPPAPTSTSKPETAATAAAQAILRGIALPPGAHAINNEPAPLKQGGELKLSSLEAEVSGMWLIPGTVAATVAFARAHPASGFTPNCTCGGRTIKWIDFYNRDQTRAVNYLVAPYAAGVAVKITAIVPWVPIRPRWSYVAGTATSVEVTVQRVRKYGSVGGAPTVHSTLTGDAERRLADIANGLPAEAPAICSGPIIMIRATDTLVFHEPDRSVTFRMDATNCPQFRVEVTGHNAAYLDTRVLDAGLLHELGLLSDYGH